MNIIFKTVRQGYTGYIELDMVYGYYFKQCKRQTNIRNKDRWMLRFSSARA